LNNFISEIRNCPDKASELKRVEKELANIRQKFTASEKLNSYHKKKYIWKLVYIFVLGYDVDFGHKEAISLMLSTKYSEKVVGYAAVALMVHPTESPEEVLNDVISAIKQDLGRADDAAQCLALACIANLGGNKLAGPLAGPVQRLLVAQDSHVCVRKKAALCLLRLFRTNPECVVHGEWGDRLTTLLGQRHLGALTSALSLLLGLASRAPAEYAGLVPHAVSNLHALAVGNQGSGPDKAGGANQTLAGGATRCRADYLYYHTPSPWLQVKLLKFLQFYPAPTDKALMLRLNAVLGKILGSQGNTSESINKSNADHAILFECVNLIVHQGLASDQELRQQALSLLGRYISVREPNMRYLGLQTMARLAQLEGNDAIKKHEATVLGNLRDADISVRRRSLDLLFVMCDRDNSVNIVEELVQYLAEAPETIREEMVLKIAIVAEKYAVDLEWYVTTILKLITLAGDHVSDDIWHRLIIMVTNHKDLQLFAAEKLFVGLQSSRAHETLVKVGAYVLGEFGFLVADKPGRSGSEQVKALLLHFPSCTHGTQGLLLSSLVKMGNLYEECRPQVQPVFAKFKNHASLDLQQRACEYSALTTQGGEMMEDVLREMPAWNQDRKSALEHRVHATQTATADGNAWVKESKAAASQAKDASGKLVAEGGSLGSKHATGAAGSAGAAAKPADLLDLDLGSTVAAASAVSTAAKVFKSKAAGGNGGGNGSGGGAAAAAAAAAPPPPPAAASPATAFGATAFGATVEAVSPPEVVTLGAESHASMRQWFNALVLNQTGVLFENDAIQVGFRHAYQAHQAKIAVYLKNKSSTVPLVGPAAEINTADASYLSVAMGVSLPPAVEPGQSAQLVLTADCMACFEGAPECVVAFSQGNHTHRYPLRLPMVATKFMDPVGLSAADFMARWQALAPAATDKEPTTEEPAREQVAVFPRPAGVIDALVVSDVRARVLGGLNLGPTTGLDNANPLQVTCAGTFRTGATNPPNGSAAAQRVSIGVLVKLDASGANWRLMVRAVHGKLAVALKNVVKAQLLA